MQPSSGTTSASALVTAVPHTSHPLWATIRAIVRVTNSGNFLEQFDFFLFGFYAPYISYVFFPKGLITTLGLMAMSTVLIAFVLGYATIELLMLIGRLLEGFSADAELGSVSAYLVELATMGKKDLYAT